MTENKHLTINADFELSTIRPGGCYSFLNFASLSSFFKNEEANGINYFCDGFLMCKLVSLLSGNKVSRVSFDFTSIAEDVFQFAEKNQKAIFLVGANEEEINAFQEKLLQRYPNILLKGYRNGFFPQHEENELIEQIKRLSVDIVVAGLGAGKQEQFILNLKSAGYQGCSFTCGGFIRQEAGSLGDYYPDWINRMGLRAFYRMYKEPHTIKRYLIDYPKNAFSLIGKVVSKKINVQVL